MQRQGQRVTLIVPEVQQRTSPQQDPMSVSEQSGPAAQWPMLLQWKVTGQSGVAAWVGAGAVSKPAASAASWI